MATDKTFLEVLAGPCTTTCREVSGGLEEIDMPHMRGNYVCETWFTRMSMGHGFERCAAYDTACCVEQVD
eukprot:4242159-Amphidinium_carterae.1